MSEASSVTLIFYRVGKQWWKEPALNLLTASAQRSAYTHVELAIGDDALDDGSMTNVVRIFNDPTGVEVTSRTGRNPLYSYVSLGCSKGAERRMLAFARQQIGKPFRSAPHLRTSPPPHLPTSPPPPTPLPTSPPPHLPTSPFSNSGMARSLIWPRQPAGPRGFAQV